MTYDEHSSLGKHLSPHHGLRLRTQADGYFTAGDRRVLSNLIFYVTLPAMLIAGFSEVHVDSWFAVSFLLGLAVNTLMLLAGTLASRKKPPELQALYTINCAGLNLGNLAIPYFQNFFPAGIPYLCMFDTGDSFFSLGTTYAIACTRLGQKSGSLGFRLKAVLRSLTRSVPFVTYLLMTTLALLHIQLPAPVLQAADFAGRGNGFLAMLLVGVSLELRLERHSIRELLEILAIRYACGTAMALVIWYLLPAPLPMRQVLALSCFSASPSAGLIYSHRLGIHTEIAGALSSITTMLMIPLTSVIMAIMG